MDYKDLEKSLRCPTCYPSTVYRLKANGQRQFNQQCLTCGAVLGKNVKTTEVEKIRATPQNDSLEKALRDRVAAAWKDHCQKEQKARERAQAMERVKERKEWFAAHTAYLKSPEWAAKRKAVLRRNPICQACGFRAAVQAHHLTYKHWRNEPLFELVAVCVRCHAKITEMDREA
jgi:hypothetical protein